MHHAVLSAALAVACVLSVAAPARADEAIATDRPDFVESSLTVGRGRVQLEASVAWESSGEPGGGTFSTPTLLRIGTGERWELRLEGDGRRHAGGPAPDGWGDVSVGAKYHLRERGGAPSMAWLLHADLPSGDDEPAGRGVRPSLRFVAEWELPRGWSLGVMPGVQYEREAPGEGAATGLLGAVVGRGIGERARAFAEFEAARIGPGEDEAALSVGAAWLLGRDAQLDLAFSHGLTDAAADRAFTVGLSRRW